MSETKTTKKESATAKSPAKKSTVKTTATKKAATKTATVKKTAAKATVEVVKKKKPIPVPTEKEGTVSGRTKILFVASEARPFIATGGLADVIGSLPQALAQDPSYDIRVVLPLYSDMKPEQRRKLSFMGNIYTPQY